MQMTRIQRDALARARRGDFELADAIELEARINKPMWRGDVCCGYRAHRLIALGEGEQEYDRCEDCRGSGEEPCAACDVDGLVKCPQCKGRGTVSGPLGAATECPKCAATSEIECPECGGERSVPCTSCNGTGDEPSHLHIRRVVDLNGRELWREESEGGGIDNPEPGRLVTLEWAEAVIRKYHNEAAAEGAATTTGEAA